MARGRRNDGQPVDHDRDGIVREAENRRGARANAANDARAAEEDARARQRRDINNERNWDHAENAGPNPGRRPFGPGGVFQNEGDRAAQLDQWLMDNAPVRRGRAPAAAGGQPRAGGGGGRPGAGQGANQRAAAANINQQIEMQRQLGKQDAEANKLAADLIREAQRAANQSAQKRQEQAGQLGLQLQRQQEERRKRAENDKKAAAKKKKK
jgi:hypothetical protein